MHEEDTCLEFVCLISSSDVDPQHAVRNCQSFNCPDLSTFCPPTIYISPIYGTSDGPCMTSSTESPLSLPLFPSVSIQAHLAGCLHAEDVDAVRPSICCRSTGRVPLYQLEVPDRRLPLKVDLGTRGRKGVGRPDWWRQGVAPVQCAHFPSACLYLIQVSIPPQPGWARWWRRPQRLLR